jgi:hypothetical protein
VDAVWLEFVDEDIAFEEERGGAERQIKLRGGQSFRTIRPAGVIDGNLRCMHDDPFDVIRFESATTPADVAQRIERGVVAADARIEFERDTHGLEPFAEAVA